MAKLTETEVLAIIREYLEGLFPKECSNCQRRYFTLREYLLTTRQLGDAVSVNPKAAERNQANPVGTLTFANCTCGNTIALSSERMPLPQLWSLFDWARAETQIRGQTPRQLFDHLRDELWKIVLSGPPP
jgi:hypothetical protein